MVRGQYWKDISIYINDVTLLLPSKAIFVMSLYFTVLSSKFGIVKTNI